MSEDFAPVEALFPLSEQRHVWDETLTRELAEARARVATGAVSPTLDMATFRQQLADFDFRAPTELTPVLSWVIDQLEHGLVHVTHPRYFGLFNPAPTFPAQCADRIAAAFNPQLATSTTSPIAVAIEDHVIRAVAGRIGLPSQAAGHFTTGGAEANYTALILALHHANAGFVTDGARAFSGRPVFYVSADSHLAWIKIGCQAGIGRSAARLIATNGSGAMDPSALARAIEADKRDGHVPVMVVATAGTTNSGTIDPLLPCHDVSRAHGLWFHVDAAWGGALIASDRLGPLLTGIETADSVTIDAHKWFATTMGCGMFLTRYPADLASVFQVDASYMPSSVAGKDPYLNTVQWSRRFVGLRLFLSLAAAGWKGYGAHVERSVGLAAILRDRLIAEGWTVANDSALGVLCIEPSDRRSVDVRSIVRHVVAEGRAWISLARFEGRDVIRACITNGETSLTDIETLVNTLLTTADPQQQ